MASKNPQVTEEFMNDKYSYTGGVLAGTVTNLLEGMANTYSKV